MRKTPLWGAPLLTRSDDEWLIGEMGTHALLKASVGGEPNQPPTTGWRFKNNSDWEEDPTLSCTIPSTSPPCCLTVILSGAAKEAQGKCEGEYKSTGLVRMGREVKLQFYQNFHLSLKVFKLEGSSDFYLFVTGQSVPT